MSAVELVTLMGVSQVAVTMVEHQNAPGVRV